MIKQITTNLERVFIPKFDGNDKVDPSDQIKFHYRAITSSMKEKLFPRTIDYQKDEKTGEMLPMFSITINMQKVVSELTTSIENCGYALNGAESKKIATVQQLFEAPPDFYPLIEEVYAFYNELFNQKVDEKN
jgi:hypothetical protein